MDQHEHSHHHEHEHGHCHGHEHEHEHSHGHSHGHGHVHSHESKTAVVNRLARAIGHLEKVKRMVQEDVDCAEVLTQLAAVRGALNNTAKLILQDHIAHCVVDAVAEGDDKTVADLVAAIDKFIK